MCLVNYKGAFNKKIATEDIECYKVVRNVDGITSYSLYQGYAYDKNKEYALDKKIEIRKENENYDYIEYGFHSYKNLTDAERDAFFFYIVVKCIIPKGSVYYEGKNGSMLNGEINYVSDKIKIVNIIY